MDDQSATGLNLNEVLRRDDFDDKVGRDIQQGTTIYTLATSGVLSGCFDGRHKKI